MRRADHYIDVTNFNRKQRNIIKRTIKAYSKLGLIEEVSKRGKVYTVLISDIRWDHFRHELACSFKEAGLA